MNRTNKASRQQSLPQKTEIIFEHDLAGNITFLNHTAEEISGYSCEEARQMNLAQIVAPEFAAEVCVQIARCLRDVPPVYEVDIITRDGRRVELEVSTEVIERNGKTVEIRGIAVPSVLRTESPRTRRARCLDESFTFSPVLANARGRVIEVI